MTTKPIQQLIDKHAKLAKELLRVAELDQRVADEQGRTESGKQAQAARQLAALHQDIADLCSQRL